MTEIANEFRFEVGYELLWWPKGQDQWVKLCSCPSAEIAVRTRRKLWEKWCRQGKTEHIPRAARIGGGTIYFLSEADIRSR